MSKSVNQGSGPLYDDEEAFWRADSRRERQTAEDFTGWVSRDGARKVRLTWVPSTGELYAADVPGGGVVSAPHARVFGLELPTGAVQVVGHVPPSWRGEPAELVAELLEHDALAEQQCHSLEWALEQLATRVPTLEQLTIRLLNELAELEGIGLWIPDDQHPAVAHARELELVREDSTMPGSWLLTEYGERAVGAQKLPG